MDKINFTVGPVSMSEDVLNIGSRQIPYFRTPEFSEVMFENEKMVLELLNAPEGSRVVFLTCSGTGAMEAAVINLFSQSDKLLIVNGGSFGKRFTEICDVHKIPYEEIKLSFGEKLTGKDLAPYENAGFTGFLVNIHETSTGVLYDKNLIADFCRRNNLRLVVDAISSFLADSLDMSAFLGGTIIFGSQKAIALPPGIAGIVLSPEATEYILSGAGTPSFYFNLKLALKDGERGQTPFTPAVGILLQMNQRLKRICGNGIDLELKRTRDLAEDFRTKIKAFPFEIASEAPSFAMTSLRVLPECKLTAYQIFEILKDEYGIFVCPNGGVLKDVVFRVGHIGNLSIADNDALISALWDMKNKGIL